MWRLAHVSIFCWLWLAGPLLAVHGELIITKASREINLVTQSTNILEKFAVKNSGRKAVEAVDFCFPTDFLPHISILEVFDEKDTDQRLYQISPSKQQDPGKQVSCLSAILAEPLGPGKTTNVQLVVTFTQLQKPFPAAIFQNEPQRVLYHDTIHILSPYKVMEQTTKVHLPDTKVESFTEASPSSRSGKDISYGPHENTPPFTVKPMRLHFENNTPFQVATQLRREVEVSHWGNVYVEEHYIIRHTGAKLRGEFSRLDLMKNPSLYGQAAIRGFMASLPKSAHSVYFRDPIGNISTSTLVHGLHTLDIMLSSRYPLYGGWSTEFTLGYSVPLQDVVRKGTDGTHQLAMLFGSPVMGLVIEDVEIRVVLPEGAKPRGVQTAFEVDKGAGKKFTYLDTHGRPVILLHRTNIGIEHMVAYTVQYTFSTFSLLQEPLLLVAAFALAFSFVIAYNRCNFRITRDAKWAAEHRAERAAYLLQQIGSIVSERKRIVSSASQPSASDVRRIQQQFAASAEELKQRCQELETLGGPGIRSKVEQYLEEERALQARVNQITSSASKTAQSDGSKAQPGVQSALKQVYTEAQKQFNENISPLQ